MNDKGVQDTFKSACAEVGLACSVHALLAAKVAADPAVKMQKQRVVLVCQVVPFLCRGFYFVEELGMDFLHTASFAIIHLPSQLCP